MQYFLCIKCIRFPLVPIFLFWNLCIQNGLILPDVFALFFADLLFDCRRSPRRSIIQHIKIDTVSLALCLCQYAVFAFLADFNVCIVVCYPCQHIPALTDVNDSAVNLNTVNPGAFVFVRKSFAFEPIINSVCVCRHWNTNSICFGSCTGFGLSLPSAFGRGIVISFTFGISISIPLG